MKTLVPISCYIADLADSDYWLAKISNDGDDYSLKTPLKEASVYAFTKTELREFLLSFNDEAITNQHNYEDGHKHLSPVELIKKLLP